MVSMQNHLCRSGCFVFLHCDSRYCDFCLSHTTYTYTSRFHVTPLEPPSFKMLFVLFYHVVALEAAAFTQTLQNLHKSNLAVKRNNLRVINKNISPPRCEVCDKTQSLCMPFICLSKSLTHYVSSWRLTKCLLTSSRSNVTWTRLHHLTWSHIWRVFSPPRLCCLHQSSVLLFFQSPKKESFECTEKGQGWTESKDN